jgi:hypothetical protein
MSVRAWPPDDVTVAISHNTEGKTTAVRAASGGKPWTGTVWVEEGRTSTRYDFVGGELVPHPALAPGDGGLD